MQRLEYENAGDMMYSVVSQIKLSAIGLGAAEAVCKLYESHRSFDILQSRS